jgi:hypothetical protein
MEEDHEQFKPRKVNIESFQETNDGANGRPTHHQMEIDESTSPRSTVNKKTSVETPEEAPALESHPTKQPSSPRQTPPEPAPARKHIIVESNEHKVKKGLIDEAGLKEMKDFGYYTK